MSSQSGQLKRILVIDDEKITRITLAKVLKKSGYDIVEADNGEAGIELCRQEKPDLVLLDVIMPGIDGYETCRRIRKLYNYEALPVIMLTGLNDVDSVDSAFDAGATDFITKPINWSLLGQRVRYSIQARDLYEEIHRSQARMMQAQAIAKIGYWDMNYDEQEINCSDELNKILNITDPENYKKLEDFIKIIHPDDQTFVKKKMLQAINCKQSSQFEHRIISPDGKQLFVTHKIEAIDDDTHDFSLIGIIQDISEQKRAEALISHQRYFDSLTDLPNKRSFVEKLDELVVQTVQHHTIRGVYFVGIDKFRSTTNTLGHIAGDTLIQLVSGRIKALQGEGYFVSRYSDDVFSLIGPEMKNIDAISEAAANIINLCEDIFDVEGNEIHSITSVGVSVIPVDNDKSDAIIKGAISAMNRARESGGNIYRYYSERMNKLAQEKLVLEKEMRRGLNSDEFIVYYQPQISTRTGKVVGMEGLVRWLHPEKGLTSPLDFISLAEETGLIVELGSKVLYECCRQTKEWQNEGLGDLRVGVNLSPRQFKNNDFAHEISLILSETKLQAKLLDIEITESMAVNNLSKVVKCLGLFKEMGISISMDDFGTGHSSLALLQELPLDILKIDRSFISNIGVGDNGAISSAIIAMSHSMGLRVIAEGVENEEQLQFVKDNNCDEIQGFYYSKPLPADEFREFVIRHNKLVISTDKAV